MAWNIKQKAQDHIVSTALALIAVLLLIVWQAVPAALWERISNATPKRLLWALLGLALIVAVVEAVYIVSKRAAKKRLAFNVCWDHGLNPYCPVCDVQLYLRKDDQGVDVLICPKCKFRYGLRDDSYTRLSLLEAKQSLRTMPEK